MPLAVRPHTQVMHVENVDVPAEPPPAFLERTHDAVVAVVENTFVGFRGDETLARRPQVRRVRRHEDSADLRRDHDISRAADLTEEVAETFFTQAETIVRGSVEIRHAM